MFYDKFLELCIDKNMSPSAAAIDAGFSNAAAAGWKKGAVPRRSAIKRLADYFGVDEGYFSEEAPEEKEKASALNEKVEAIMKVYDMLTPENKERFSDSLSEILSALIKEQLQG